jgi:hypothetical protein
VSFIGHRDLLGSETAQTAFREHDGRYQLSLAEQKALTGDSRSGPQPGRRKSPAKINGCPAAGSI